MRPYRETSTLAHESVKEHKARMYKLITEGLEKIKVGGTSEEISVAIGLKHEQVWKRISEMRNIYDTGIKRKNSSGRKAIVWQLKRPLVQTELFQN
jgi:hypothetical protein